MSRRSFLKSTGSIGAAAAIAGCTSGGSEDTPTDTASPTEGDGEMTPTDTPTPSGVDSEEMTLQLINTGIRTFDTVPASTTTDSEALLAIFDQLMNYVNATTTVEPLIASDVSVSDDNTTYTFTLKDGVQFHNGDTVTASDVVYSWERLAASPNSERAFFILDTLSIAHETDGDGNYVPGSMELEAVDEQTVEFTVSKPFHAALQLLAYSSFSVIPEGIVDDLEGYEGEMTQSEFAKNPVGSGPFTFEKHAPDTETVLTAFDNYHGDGPHIAGIRWSVIQDQGSQLQYAMNKNADIFDVHSAQYDPDLVDAGEPDSLGRRTGSYGPMSNGETVNYIKVPSTTSDYIGFNTEVIPKAVRQAVAYAANQHQIVRSIYKDRHLPAYHFTPINIYPGGSEAYTQHAQEGYPYGYNESQLDNARQVMSDAGYGEDDRFEFTLSTYTSGFEEIAQLLRDQLSSAYIDINVERTDFGALAGKLLNGNIEAYTLGWHFEWPAPDNFLQLLNPPYTDTSAQDNVGFTNWGGTEAAQRAANAWQQVQDNRGPGEAAKEARNEAYVDIEEANWEDMIQLPLFHESQEKFWYPWVDFPKFGGGLFYRLKKNKIRFVSERN